ncbi:MAG: hypothetical protein ABI665_25460, partial [Vicinamibacterales bacterium]
MRRTVTTLMFVALLVALSQNAAAQTPAPAPASGWEDRAYINVNWGVESGNTDFTDTKSFSLYEETGTLTSTSSFSSGSLFDVAVGIKVWRNLSVGAAYHQEGNIAPGSISGTVPHPIFFNAPRTFTTTVEGLERKENAEHLVIGWTVPIGSKLDIMVFGGPSFFRLQQDVVSDARVAEAGAPFTQVIVQPTVETRKKSVLGYNAGADISYLFWQNDAVRLGGGVFFRYTAATTDILMLTTE